MDKYGLIGFPLGHSFSRAFFTEKFAREGINAQYVNYEIEDARQLLDIVRSTPTLKGLNCTIPHKQAIIPLLDWLSPEAQEIGAVNVVKICRTPEGIILQGYNSDIIGFRESIRPLLRPTHRQALILGTGGASRAIRVALTQLGIRWKLVSRKGTSDTLRYDDITPDVLQQFTLIVNCSPVGMHPHVNEAPLLPYEALTTEHLLFDLIYNPEATRFLQLGARQGATIKNGLEMLHLQAIASWDIWNQSNENTPSK